MIVDGYNVIHAWGMGNDRLEDARAHLLHILDDYAGFSGEKITVVFDGYKTRKRASQQKSGLLDVIYTAHGVTADIHIQRMVKESDVRRKVVTADYLEQLSVFASGAVRITPEELALMIRAVREKHIQFIDKSSLSKSEMKKRLVTDSFLDA